MAIDNLINIVTTINMVDGFIFLITAVFASTVRFISKAALLHNMLSHLSILDLKTDCYGWKDAVLNSKYNSFMVIKMSLCGRLSKQWLVTVGEKLNSVFFSVTFNEQQNNSGAKSCPWNIIAMELFMST